MPVTKEGHPKIFIAKGHAQRWRFTWHAGEWRGDTLTPPRTLDSPARLIYSVGSLAFHSNGACSLFWSVTNSGPEPAFFSAWTTSY